jgi:undecaprenyl-diphosphatase
MRWRKVDRAGLALVAPRGRSATSSIAATASDVARGGAAWWALAAALSLFGRRGRRIAVSGMSGWCAGHVVASGLKAAVHRPRPRSIHTAGSPVHTSSMPSTHAASAMGFAAAAGVVDAGAAPVLVPLAGLVGWGRLVNRRHFPSDVAVGAAIGGVIGIGVGVTLRRACQRRQMRSSPARFSPPSEEI